MKLFPSFDFNATLETETRSVSFSFSSTEKVDFDSLLNKKRTPPVLPNIVLELEKAEIGGYKLPPGYYRYYGIPQPYSFDFRGLIRKIFEPNNN